MVNSENVTKAFTSINHPPTRAASKQQLYLCETVAQHSKSQVFPSVLKQQLLNGILLENLTINVTKYSDLFQFYFQNKSKSNLDSQFMLNVSLSNVILERNIYMWGAGCVQI